MRVLLISTYDLGHQPFGLASPAAWLRRSGAEVTCQDLALERLNEEAVRASDLVAFYLPMHTATRIAARVVPRVRLLNPGAHLCFYGLYAPVNERYLRGLGAGTILGGEYEAPLASLVERLSGSERSAHPPARPGEGGESGSVRTPPLLDFAAWRPEAGAEPIVWLARQKFLRPEREGLVPLSRYARLVPGEGETRTTGYTEASRGCKHFCRHCPVVPVYQGRFFIVQREVVLEDIRQQVAGGAEHITFGDPDFFNGVGHALAIVRSLHEAHPRLTYDVTIKIEHLLRHARHLRTLRETGCLFVTSAVESIDDRVLGILDKGHTKNDFIQVVHLFREEGLTLNPTFVPFTPWISVEGYLDLLSVLAELGLADHVAPVQLAIRLLIPAGSRLLELTEVRDRILEFDETGLVYPWVHEDLRVDRLQATIQTMVQAAAARGESRREIFSRVWELAADAAGRATRLPVSTSPALERTSVPYLTEPWYC